MVEADSESLALVLRLAAVVVRWHESLLGHDLGDLGHTQGREVVGVDANIPG